MQDLELQCFKIIAQAGEAKSNYLQYLKYFKRGEIEKAEELFKLGDQAFLVGHQVHAHLIQQEASGNPVTISLLLMHAEDQMMSTETVKLLVEEISELYQERRK